MEERQVYISFESPEYNLNKAELLKCKVEVIELQKKLISLHALRSHKRRLIAHLKQLVEASEFVIEKIDGKIPDPTMPKQLKGQFKKKSVKVKKETIKSPKAKVVKEDFDVSDLDKELIELNRRIRELS